MQPRFSAEREKAFKTQMDRWNPLQRGIPILSALFNVSSPWKLCRVEAFHTPCERLPSFARLPSLQDYPTYEEQQDCKALKWTDGISPNWQLSHTSKMKLSMLSQVVQKKKVSGEQKPITDVRIGWLSPTEERDHLNIEKLTALIVI